MEKTDTKVGLDYARGSIPSLFCKVFFPTLLGMIFNALLTIIDGIFVGRGVGPDGIAAVNIIAPVFMVTTGVGLMFGIGSAVTAGIALASDNRPKANAIITSAFMVATLIIAILVGLCALFPDGTARLLGSSDALLWHARGYLAYLLLGIVPLMWQSIGMMVIRLDGSPKYAMMCNILPALLNIVLDWWFVFPMGMGVRGAALATSLACIVGGVMAVTYFRFSYVLKFTRHLAGFTRLIANQVAVGAAAFITEIAMSVMMFTGNVVFMRSFGEAGVAAFSIACYLFPLIFMINNAVAQSAQPIISVNYGAGNPDRVRRALRVSIIVASICGLAATLGISLGTRWIVGMFISPESQAARIAVAGLPIFATTGIVFALNIAFIGFYQSIEKSLAALVLTLLRGVVILVPLFLLLPRLFPQWGMWAAIPASEAITLLIILTTFRSIAGKR
ncbi:MAG: MATE family efflux transporter [Bacteroidales bacterium]|nr:MATE family efflux transporter [Bacteroidales bacterium]